MLLLQRSGAPPTVSARAHQVDLLPAHEWQRLTAFCSTTPTLYLPLASEGGLPFLRVLGWKGLSAIRERALHETEALAGVPKFFDADISLDGDGPPPLKKAKTQAASLGVRYRALGGGGGRGGGPIRPQCTLRGILLGRVHSALCQRALHCDTQRPRSGPARSSPGNEEADENKAEI
jgi:hypothetical protein